ncbi:Glutathione S-transferase/chloride channel, C-terminal [Artemisia annua]|uniref:Glutathione S-transferase/chloride channel, C-terminal n=1 Tax=Artemisia annua TaxID=35608 RepID=A0A2U1P785_ARTAN|nr:Glutathione S-transferase/chloride channel, C-terminal [Artemisia annua]
MLENMPLEMKFTWRTCILRPKIDNAINRYKLDMTEFPLLLKLNNSYNETPSFLAEKPQQPLGSSEFGISESVYDLFCKLMLTAWKDV